jgi:hypothetical protein
MFTSSYIGDESLELLGPSFLASFTGKYTFWGSSKYVHFPVTNLLPFFLNLILACGSGVKS